MKKLADEKYISSIVEKSDLYGPENFELFGINPDGKDSKWRRWIRMTVDRFYAFWVAKLVIKFYGWNIESYFSRTSFTNICRKGQPLYG